ncbi:hypothetical protein L3Y34_009751 [Caenorhabditis briggsae]|uniref:F-box domain-containing protein n=1 Tax=Caenorhabditis briggsae TaxID=6238 RepID=A0AAE9A7X0_CAEBR|nr:hypothetical protein L3Y34_009751 [Caenorhabditis briggsae]
MNESAEFIKNDDHCLKTCILYEALEKKPVFDAYKSFSDTVGKDAMEYTDFEFWYYRFLHKQHDFNYDRKTDPVPKTIMNMPASLLYKITENLDTVERTYLRSMNKSIKAVSDSHPLRFHKIDISTYDTWLTWRLDNKSFGCYLNGNGCSLKIPNFPEIKSDEYYLKKGLEYLSPVLKMPNLEVNHLSLNIKKESAYFDDLLPVPFHAKRVSINSFSINKSLELLTAMNPGELESINFSSLDTFTREEITKFLDTEQFQQAKNVQSNMCLNEDDLLKFSHLKSFECGLPSRVDFQRIRDIISTFKQFESCELKRANYLNDFDIRTVAEALAAEIPFGPLAQKERLIITHRYQIPESNKFLEFKMEEMGYHCYIKIDKIR